MSPTEREARTLEMAGRIAERFANMRPEDVTAVLAVALPPKWLGLVESTIEAGVRAP